MRFVIVSPHSPNKKYPVGYKFIISKVFTLVNR
nr:MAG TPA: hypothetical protein [Caudoviricetes sp.]